MVTVGLRCRYCQKQFSVEVAFKMETRHWALRMWKSAVQQGWVRDQTDNSVACPDCQAQVAVPSSKIIPVEPLPFVATLNCDSCGTQLLGGKPIFKQGFSAKLRATSRNHGWVYTSHRNNASYQDLCSNCALATNRYEELLGLVWSRPTSQAAQELGLSDKAIEKQCRIWNVPKPPRGFWAKWHAGHMLECRQMLPADVKDRLGNILIDQVFPLPEDQSY